MFLYFAYKSQQSATSLLMTNMSIISSYSASISFFSLSVSFVALASVYIVWKWIKAIQRSRRLKHIPTIGSSGLFTSYFDAFKHARHGHHAIQEGYDKYYGSAFKVPLVGEWLIIVSGPQMVDDIRRAGDDDMSFDDATAETFQTDYTVGPALRLDPYHTTSIRRSLTRNISLKFDDIRDELTSSFDGIVQPKLNEWTTVPALSTAMNVICRTGNRVFLGLPLCRDQGLLDLNFEYAHDLVNIGQMINIFPGIMTPIFGRLLTKLPQSVKRMTKYVGPMIQYQLEQEELHDYDWKERPNNLISWLIRDARKERKNLEDMIRRVLLLNFAAIHTTSHALTQALYDLAAYPEYISPLREEVESIIKEEGWNKTAIGRMHKLDSFLKESQRLAVPAFRVERKLKKDFTFSNGVTVPGGTHIAVATWATHMDERNYENPEQFQGFRFVEKRTDEKEHFKHQFVSLAPEFLLFGAGGRHACPGRFFAANELKTMLAHIILNYDIKLPDGGSRPENFWYEGQVFPNLTANILFRKRNSAS